MERLRKIAIPKNPEKGPSHILWPKDILYLRLLDAFHPFVHSRSAIYMKKNDFVDMALSFPWTETCPHFERIGFKIIGKKMFATYLEKDNTANIFLTPMEQSVFCRMNPAIYPVANKWGEKGATTFKLDLLPAEIVLEALLSAYRQITQTKK